MYFNGGHKTLLFALTYFNKLNKWIETNVTSAEKNILAHTQIRNCLRKFGLPISKMI